MTAYIGLGGNLGDRALALQSAVRALEQSADVRLLRRSRVYETEPVGPPQPRYLNAVVEIETRLSARALLSVCFGIEAKLGRKRVASAPKLGPRSIDLDILLYGDEVIAEPGLVIPHPELHTRAFALAPLCDLAAARKHPALGCRLDELLAKVDRSTIRPTEDAL